ncbi:MAG: 4Fe-4S binding protein [Bacillota bacterium]
MFEKPEGEKARVAHPEKCTRCGLCEIMCPDFAIAVAPVRKPSPRDQEGGADA